jgi:hypothetical protein
MGIRATHEVRTSMLQGWSDDEFACNVGPIVYANDIHFSLPIVAKDIKTDTVLRIGYD